MFPYDYNYYNVPSGREIFSDWDNTVKFADAMPSNVWYYYHNGSPIPEHWGKPLDESCYLWFVKPDSSFARNSAFCASRGSTLYIQFSEYVEEKQVPLAMAAMDRYTAGDGEFSTYPHSRLADNDSKYAGYVYAGLAYDIPYSHFCIHAQASVLRRDASPATVSPFNLTALKAHIDASPDTRDVIFINPVLYGGDNNDRRETTCYTSGQSNASVFLPDILTYRPIPVNADYVIAEIKDGEPPGANWETSKVYNPWAQSFGGAWGSGWSSTYNQQLRIGVQQYISYINLRNGLYDYVNIGQKITGRFFRASSDIQYYDDVAFRWVTKVYDVGNNIFIQNGFNISGSGNVRIVTMLDIVDAKGQTKGEASVRACRHEIAAIGFYFADTQTLAQSAVLGSAGSGAGIYLPEFVNRTTTGYYFTGDEIKDVPYADAESVGGDLFPYDPEEVEGDEGDFTTQLQSGALSAGTVYYALSDTELKDLLRYLNTTYSPDETTLAEDFKGANPFEYITSVKYYPFCLPYSVAQSINIGPIGTGVTGYIMPYTYGNSSYSFFDMGSFTFTPRYNNFLDYSGTQINLYLPWCGTKQLDPAMWIVSPGQQPITLNIKYSFDYVTGAVTAFLFRDSMLIDTADGQVGIDIPMSALATGSYQAQIAQAQIAYKQAATSRFTAWLGLVGSMIGTAVAAASGVGAPAVVGGLAGIATSVQSLQKTGYAEEAATYTLDHTSPNVGSVSAASPFNAAIFDQRPRILISRPQLQQLPTNWAESYGKSIGYACSIPTKLNNAAIKGLTVVQAPRLQGIKKVIGTQTYTPTREELDLIRQAMAEGIIL